MRTRVPSVVRRVDPRASARPRPTRRICAGGGLVCSFGLPALIHGKVHWRRGTLTLWRGLLVGAITAFGVFCFSMQLIPGAADAAGANGTANGTNATG